MRYIREIKEEERVRKKEGEDGIFRREKKKNIGNEKVEEGAESGRVVAEKEGKEGAGTSTAASKTTCADFDNDALRRHDRAGSTACTRVRY